MATQLSRRGDANVSNAMPRIPRTVLEAGWVPNEDSLIDLSMAENWLIREEILEIQKTVVADHLNREVNAGVVESVQTLTGPNPASKLPQRLLGKSWTAEEPFGLFQQILQSANSGPSIAHCVGPWRCRLHRCSLIQYLRSSRRRPGAGSILEYALDHPEKERRWYLADGYDTFFSLRADVVPVAVPIPRLEEPASFLSELEATFQEATRPIKALLLSNPHNPLGRCFTQAQLEACLRFCQAKAIHLISDEVFGPLTFDSPDLPADEHFVSVLSLDSRSLGCDPSRVHMIWSPSKVFAIAGMRIVSPILSRHRPLSLPLNHISTQSFDHSLPAGMHRDPSQRPPPRRACAGRLQQRIHPFDAPHNRHPALAHPLRTQRPRRPPPRRVLRCSNLLAQKMAPPLPPLQRFVVRDGEDSSPRKLVGGRGRGRAGARGRGCQG